MPLLKHALKKQRHDQKKTLENYHNEKKLKSVLKTARKKLTPKNISIAFKSIDKAAKTHLIHSNKAARLKSRLAKLSIKK